MIIIKMYEMKNYFYLLFLATLRLSIKYILKDKAN